MKIIGSICLLFVLIGCKKSDHLSECIQTSVKQFKTSNICDDGASVKEYLFQGKLVYVFAEGNCISDSGAGVSDANCNTLGYLGGIAGLRLINGIDFYANAEFKRTIWHN